MRPRPIVAILKQMRNPELLPAFAAGFAVSFAYLRWIVLTQWKCAGCGDAHIHCECKPRWFRALL